MNYGIPTLMEFPNVEDLAGFCAGQGFSFVEMNNIQQSINIFQISKRKNVVL